MTREKKRKHPWRENIEALTMAIGVALVFKVFLLEISRIPSGSMQPTLMGDEATEVFDRIVVDKLSYSYRDPRRWEIVVFKHPLERSRIMVKRLVGLPNEELKIEHGDVWTRPNAVADWTVERRPEEVQAAQWKTLEPKDQERSQWSAVEGAVDWRFTGRVIKASGSGRAGFRVDQGSIRNGYRDGYPDPVRAEARAGRGETHDVGDLRLDGDLIAREGTERVTIELVEGKRVYRFRFPGPAADPTERVEIEVRETGVREALGTHRLEQERRLPAGVAVHFSVENLDDRLRLSLDDEELLTANVDPVPSPRSAIRVGVDGSGAEFQDLMPYRDLFYVPEPGNAPNWTVEIPAEHYVMFGDNTLDSADSRAWLYNRFTWSEDGEEVSAIGNWRPGMSGANPIAVTFGDEQGDAFRDQWGDLHWLPQSSQVEFPPHRIADRGTRAPLVPRDLIKGRAMAVFWPISIGRRMWRLGWLH